MPDVNESPTDPNDDMFSPHARRLFERVKALVRQEIRARRVSTVEAAGVAFATECWTQKLVEDAMDDELDDEGDGPADGLPDFVRDPDAWKKGGRE